MDRIMSLDTDVDWSLAEFVGGQRRRLIRRD